MHGNALLCRSFVNGTMDDYVEKCWRRQVWETDSWKQVRGPAGAAVFEPRNLGIGFPRWRALSEEGVFVVMQV